MGAPCLGSALEIEQAGRQPHVAEIAWFFVVLTATSLYEMQDRGRFCVSGWSFGSAGMGDPCVLRTGSFLPLSRGLAGDL